VLMAHAENDAEFHDYLSAFPRRTPEAGMAKLRGNYQRPVMLHTNIEPVLPKHPTAEWIARQITEAFPWNEAPRYLIRDRDQVYGAATTRRLRAMGIRDKPIAPGSPLAERLCRKIDRINSARVRRPYRRAGRDALAPSPKILRQILQ
jgi:hypothetical protein